MQLLPIDSEIVALLVASPATPVQSDPWGLGAFLHLRRTVTAEVPSPIRMTFLNLCSRPADLPKDAIVGARDGLLPLYLFFRKCPEPAEFSGTLLIPARLGAIVPEAWEAQTLLFRFRSAGRAVAAPSHLVLCGLADEESLSLDSLEAKLEQARAGAGKRLRRVSCFIPHRRRAWSPDFTFLPEMVRQIRRMFAGTEMAWLDQAGFEGLAADGETVFHEINHEEICSVSRLSWGLLSRGFRPVAEALEGRKRPEPVRVIPVSPSHVLEAFAPRALAGPERAALNQELWNLGARSHVLRQFLERGLD